jgi:hypothetical protein
VASQEPVTLCYNTQMVHACRRQRAVNIPGASAASGTCDGQQLPSMAEPLYAEPQHLNLCRCTCLLSPQRCMQATCAVVRHCATVSPHTCACPLPADFGLSINHVEERPVTRVGTLDYMAPEVVVCPDKHHPNDHKELTHLHYTAVVDAWAVGVLAYELVVGKAPFDKVRGGRGSSGFAAVAAAAVGRQHWVWHWSAAAAWCCRACRRRPVSATLL